MKKYFLIGLLLCSALAATTYDDDADMWVSSYIINQNDQLKVSSAHLQLILNLLYFSYKRSQATLDIQPIALKALEGLWKGWLNILRTRRDPSTKLHNEPYTKEEKHYSYHFWQQYIEHRESARSYNHAVNHVIHGELLSDTIATLAIENLRHNARSIITSALTDIQYHLGNIFQQMTRSDKLSSRGILDFVTSYLGKLAQESFIQADDLNTTASREIWELFKSTQEIGNYTWNTIEHARATFYLAHYRVLYNVMKQHNLENHHFGIIFDEHGLIPENKREKNITRIMIFFQKAHTLLLP